MSNVCALCFDELCDANRINIIELKKSCEKLCSNCILENFKKLYKIEKSTFPLLSATPFQNKPYEISDILSLLENKQSKICTLCPSEMCDADFNCSACKRGVCSDCFNKANVTCLFCSAYWDEKRPDGLSFSWQK